MERRDRSRHAVFLVLALAVLASTDTASAQYMYLDADGDGVHTAADVVPTTGSVTFDVWLRTDTNRDGSRAVCAQDTTASFTINSYTVILRATNGSMSWSLTNRMSGFTLRVEHGSTSFELWDGWASGTILPAGKYRLATVTATPTGGTPSVAIVPSTPNAPIAITSFGCRCDGIDGDNTLKLGNDWSDWDGLAYAGVTNYNPVLAQPSPMGVVEGQVADQDLHATDAEGEPITFSAIGAPSYMTLTTTDSGSGSGTATAHVHLAPGYADAGSGNVTIRASDPVGFDEKKLFIRVDNGNRPPVLDSIPDMTVAPGDSASQIVTAHDPDGDLLGFHKSPFPTWVALLPNDLWSARVLAAPPDSVGGIFPVTVTVTDASDMDQKTFSVTVTGPSHAPVISPMAPVEIAEGGSALLMAWATDPDGAETLRLFKRDGPSFVTVQETWVVPSGPWGQPGPWAQALVWVRPVAGDRGDYLANIAVTDGTTTVTTPLPIRVTNGYAGDTSVLVAGAAGNPLLNGASGRASGTDVGVAYQAGAMLVGSFLGEHPPTDIELVPRKDGFSCFTDHGGGRVVLAAPAGDSLRVGAYMGATRDGDASHPRLDITLNCTQATSVTGQFDVKQLEIKYGILQSAWVTFTAYVNGSAAPLAGEIRYKVRTLPVTVYAPTRMRVGAGDDVSFTVTAADSSGRSVTLSSDTPSGAAFRPADYPNPPNSAVFTWRPDLDQLGTTRVVFRGRNIAGDTASAFCDITVQPRNAVSAPLGANKITLLTSNRGVFGYDLRDSTSLFDMKIGGDAVTMGSSAGLWLGALVNGQPRVAVGGRSPEFVPGPAPAGQAQPFDPRFKNYKLVRGRTDAIDWREWPVAQGAPTDAGQPALAGDEMVWSVYNDADPTAHRAPNGRTEPLGVEVRQTTWAYAHDGPLGKTVYLKYLLRNAGPNTLANAYASIWVDPYAAHSVWNGVDSFVVRPINDRVGCDSSRAMAYAYSSRNIDYTPLALGASLLHGAVQNPGRADSIPLGLTSVRRLAGQPASALGLYRVMQGLDENGAPVLDPAGQPARYEVTGDPVSGSGWLDSLATSSRVFVLSSGPFTMAPGDSQTIVAAVVFGSGTDRITSVTDLRSTVDAIRGSSPVANTPPVLDYQSRAYTFDEGTKVAFAISAYDNEHDRMAFTATELPAGATLTGDGQFYWTVGYDQAGTRTAHIVATDAFGGWDSTTIVFTIRDVNRPPVARSGGPYRGVAGTALEFDGSASSDADGDPLMTTWTFGDGATGEGGHVLHTYATPGLYTVVLLAMDRALDDRDTTTATIAAPIQVRAFVPSGGGLIRLASPAPKVEICLEIVGGVVSLPDLQSTSFALESHGTGSVSSILAIDTDASIGGDRDGNGIPELSLAFRKSDLRALFGGLPQGRTNVSAFLTGVAGKNTAVAAPVTLTIEAYHEPLAVLLVPNPINPRGVLTFTTTRPGWARIALFDVRGRVVRRLFEAKSLAPGYHDVPIDGMDDGGRPLASGLYFFRIDAVEGTRSGRLTVLK